MLKPLNIRTNQYTFSDPEIYIILKETHIHQTTFDNFDDGFKVNIEGRIVEIIKSQTLPKLATSRKMKYLQLSTS